MEQVTEIRLNKQKNELKITFEDEMYYLLPAELLRVESPSAEVQGHSVNQKITPAGKSKVKILSIEPICPKTLLPNIPPPPIFPTVRIPYSTTDLQSKSIM